MTGAIPRIETSLIGPPASSFRNPTLLLFLAAFATFLAGTAAALLGLIPFWLAAALNTLCLYSFYTVTHESVHRTAHSRLAVNNALGRVAAALEGLSFPLFRVIHLQHHAFTNHPVNDPDFVIGRKPRWLLPLWVVVRLTHDNVFAIRRRLWAGRRRLLIEHLATVLMQVSVVVLATLYGRFQTVLLLWLVPVVVAGAILELTVAWLVHYPHESQHPLQNTRDFPGLLWQVLTLNQNLHLVHHLWARIPWFRYPQAARLAHAAAEAHGAALSASNAPQTHATGSA